MPDILVVQYKKQSTEEKQYNNNNIRKNLSIEVKWLENCK